MVETVALSPAQVRGGWGWCFRSDEGGAETRLVCLEFPRGSVQSLRSWARQAGPKLKATSFL